MLAHEEGLEGITPGHSLNDDPRRKAEGAPNLEPPARTLLNCLQ